MAPSNTTKKHDFAALESLYTEAESVDKEIFAEMRSNLLLIAGNHYQNRNAKFYKRIRDSKDLSEQSKLRLTKNHVQKIHKTYVNNVLSAAPGVGVMPKNKSELQDQKAAELNDAVWQDAVEKHDLHDLEDDWANDFFGVGEVAVKIFWDPAAGSIRAYDQKVSETGKSVFLDPQGQETEDPGMDPMSGQAMHQPAPGAPRYSGDFVFEPIYGFNLLRAPEAKTLLASPYLIIRKMVDTVDLQARFPEFAEKIKPTQDETFVVFDAHKGGYMTAQNQTLFKEYYFRPCHQYPRGYFYQTAGECIVAEGELPGGIFPIKVQACDKLQTTPRGIAPVRTMKPYQVEINRAASKMAEHQITLGDDKLLIQNGTKITSGTALPGVRAINYTGMEPGILAGRDGSQYLQYMQSQIAELYDVMNVAEDVPTEGQMDPYALLFRSATQKKRFQRYVRRFEAFQRDVCKTYLELAKLYLDDDALIYAVGRKERINIQEFRNTEDICYQIKLVGQADDLETKFGKMLQINHALQYVGNKLEKEDIGKLMRAMPYANEEEAFNDFTLDYDSGSNLILALDRGERPVLHDEDNADYLLKRLIARKRQADFDFLSPEIQNNYRTVIGIYQKIKADQILKIQRAEQGFIPTGGYMVTCQLYVADPTDETGQKTRLARIPYEALSWLIKQLEVQGQSLDHLEQMNQGSLAQMAGMIQTQGGQASQGTAMLPEPQGQDSPGGVDHASRNGLSAPVAG
jgi:hypothetical protein